MTVRIGWKGQTATAARYFNSGTSRQPARPIVGLSAGAQDEIRQAIREFAVALIGGR